MTTPKGRRAACGVLFLSLLCALVETAAAIFTLVIFAGGISIGDSLAQLVLTFFTAAAGNWMLPLLFLSLCFLLHERIVFTKLWTDAQGGRGLVRLRTIVLVYWTLFALIMLTGTALVVFFISYQRLLWGGSIDDDGDSAPLSIYHGGQFTALSYGFTSVWYATSLFIGAFAYYAFCMTRQFSSVDKVSMSFPFVKQKFSYLVSVCEAAILLDRASIYCVDFARCLFHDLILRSSVQRPIGQYPRYITCEYTLFQHCVLCDHGSPCRLGIQKCKVVQPHLL